MTNPEDPRDAEDALNVATARLSALATVETTGAEGDPAEAILEAAADRGVDEVVVGAGSGAPGTDTSLGGTVRSVLAEASVPVVVVPTPGLD